MDVKLYLNVRVVVLKDSSNSNLKDDSGVMNNSRDSPSIVGSNSSYKYREDNNNPRRNDDYKNKGYRNNNFWKKGNWFNEFNGPLTVQV